MVCLETGDQLESVDLGGSVIEHNHVKTMRAQEITCLLTRLCFECLVPPAGKTVDELLSFVRTLGDDEHGMPHFR